jgi:hypothetical protein
MEEWKEIEGLQGMYLISNKGRVLRKERTVDKGKWGQVTFPERMLIPNKRLGYDSVVIRIYNKIFKESIHRIVAKHFIPNPQNKPFINHINGIRDDNRVENLEWCTAKENSQHSWRTGLQKGKRGDTNKLSRVTLNQRLEMERMNSSGVFQSEIAKSFGLNQATVSKIIKKVRSGYYLEGVSENISLMRKAN